MKTRLLLLLILISFAQPVLALTEGGFDEYRFAMLIGFTVLIALLIFFCLLVLGAVAVDRARDTRRQRAVVRVRTRTPARGRNQVGNR
ncbi:MAG: hypothetical protein D6751_07380 [Deltaproteobacteria bacterium]|nr:MAG: hypothetical protein D6751_07380 [Deltaproteobacteria bacterium]